MRDALARLVAAVEESYARYAGVPTQALHERIKAALTAAQDALGAEPPMCYWHAHRVEVINGLRYHVVKTNRRNYLCLCAVEEGRWNAVAGEQAALGAGGGWVIRFVCCGRDDGQAVRATWTEADALRESYIAGVVVAPHGYSSAPHESGHRRAAIVERQTPSDATLPRSIEQAWLQQENADLRLRITELEAVNGTLENVGDDLRARLDACEGERAELQLDPLHRANLSLGGALRDARAALAALRTPFDKCS